MPPPPHAQQAVSRICRNCQTPLAGRFCHACGQEDKDTRRSLWPILGELIEELLSYDSRLWRTVGTLLLRPGALTVHYFKGRRAPYVPPLRTYLVCSLLFFLMVGNISETVQQEIATSLDEQGAFKRSGFSIDFGDKPARPDSLQPDSSARAAVPKADAADTSRTVTDDDVSNWVTERFQALGSGRAFVDAFLESLPTAFFLLQPFLALLLLILFATKKYFYVEHLVFSMHLQAFTYLSVTLLALAFMGAQRLGWELPGWLAGIYGVGALLYAIFALRRFYRQAWGWVVLKFFIVGFFYTLVVSFAVVGGMLLALAL